MTPLKGIDGKVYAIAQGSLVVGGLGVEGADGSKLTINVPTVGRIPNGATVELAVANPFQTGDSIVYNLHRPDFTTAKRLADRINELVGPATARPMDGGSIKVNAPRDPSQRVIFLSALENLQFTPGTGPARVVVNSRTGTIVIGQHVQVKPAAITHGSLTVTIAEKKNVEQPEAFGQGETAVVPETEIFVNREKNKMFLFDPGVSLDQLVKAINGVGAAPGDLMAILEALKQSGALEADLVVI